MTIKTNADGKVTLQVSADVEVNGGTVVHLTTEIPTDEDGNPAPVEGVVYVDEIPTVEQGNDLYFDGETFSRKPNPKYEEEKQIAALRAELAAIKAWLVANDWKINKVVIGEWSKDDKRWTDYLAAREEKRARQDFINALLGGEPDANA